jgi:hypothetical protein
VEHAWSVLCQRSLFDQNTNNVSLIDVIERVQFNAPQELDYMPFRFDLVSLWSRTDLEKPEKSNGRLEIIYAKNGEILHTLEYTIDLTETPRARGQATLRKLPFVGNGLYKFVVSIWEDETQTWQRVASVPLEVNQISSPVEE